MGECSLVFDRVSCRARGRAIARVRAICVGVGPSDATGNGTAQLRPPIQNNVQVSTLFSVDLDGILTRIRERASFSLPNFQFSKGGRCVAIAPETGPTSYTRLVKDASSNVGCREVQAHGECTYSSFTGLASVSRRYRGRGSDL